MEITGKTVAVLDLVSGTSKAGNAWQKREFVIEIPGQYPRKLCFQLFGEKVNDCPAVGDEVKVSFDPESREWQGKWFTQLNAWKVEKQGTQPTATAPQQAPAQQGWEAAYPAPQPKPQPAAQAQEDDGLPF